MASHKAFHPWDDIDNIYQEKNEEEDKKKQQKLGNRNEKKKQLYVYFKRQTGEISCEKTRT